MLPQVSQNFRGRDLRQAISELHRLQSVVQGATNAEASARSALDAASTVAADTSEKLTELQRSVLGANDSLAKYLEQHPPPMIPNLDETKETTLLLNKREDSLYAATSEEEDDGGPWNPNPTIDRDLYNQMKKKFPDDFKDTTPTPLPSDVYNLILGIQTAFLWHGDVLPKPATELAATE